MDLKVEELDEFRRKLLIKIPEDVISTRVDKAYREMNKQVKMPGFRPGKIPQKVMEQQVPLESMTDLWQELMQEYYDKALTETGMIPAGPPEIDHSEIREVKKDKPLTFSVLIEIRPVMKFKDYKGLKYKKQEFSVSEAELAMSIQKNLEEFANFEIMLDDHEVQEDDFLTLDFAGFLDGEPLDNGSAEDYKVRVGQKKMIEGFEGQLLGHKKGEEFEVQVVLPSDWNNRVRRVSMPIPGKETDVRPDVAKFMVRIKEIKQQRLPELTEELVQGQGEESVESFKRNLRAHIQSMKDHAEEIRIKQEIFDGLVKDNDVTPPESMVKQEIKFMIEGAKFQIARSGMKIEDSGFEEARAEEEWKEKATHNAKGYLILDGIANQENIHVSQEDLEEEYQRLSQEIGIEPEKVKERLFANPENMNQTTQRVRGQKTLNFVYSHCEFEFVKGVPKEPSAEEKG